SRRHVRCYRKRSGGGGAAAEPYATDTLQEGMETMSRYLKLFEVSVLAATLIVLPAAANAQRATEKGKESAQSTTEKAKEKVKETTQSAKAGETDSWITAKTKIALFADDRVSGSQVRVETKKGAVRLFGKVDTPEAKSAAESVAKGVDGV